MEYFDIFLIPAPVEELMHVACHAPFWAKPATTWHRPVLPAAVAF
jgi:hypothetical protein